MDTKRKRGGQPKPAEERKRGNLTFRVRDDLRSRLSQTATKHGRSISEEIEVRLELSEARRDQLSNEWGSDFIRIADAMAASLTFIEDEAGRKWFEDEEATQLFKLTASQIIQNYKDHVDKHGRDRASGSAILAELPLEERARWFAGLGGLNPPRTRGRSTTDTPAEDGAE